VFVTGTAVKLRWGIAAIRRSHGNQDGKSISDRL